MSEPYDAADVVILVSRMDGGGWESEVAVEGRWCGCGTGPSASSALDIAMDILYGDKNDWLNDDHGALAGLEESK